MAHYDYTLVSKLKNGTERRVKYSEMLYAVKMQNEKMHGLPLINGGVPQVISFTKMIHDMLPDIDSITILFNGEAIAQV